MNKLTSKFQTLLLCAGVLASTAMLSSCDKDDDEAKPVRPEVEIPTEFSELSVEENKANLEDNGIAMINKLTTLKSSSGIQTSIAFSHFTSVSAPSNGRIGNNKAVQMMTLLAQFGLGKKQAPEVLKDMRVRQSTEPQTAQEVFDELKGTYSFNAQTQAWDYTAGGDKIVFKFPSTKTGTSNNAEYAVYGYTSVNISNSAAEYNGDVPTGLKADLTVNGSKLMQYSWAASYTANGEPTSILSSLTIDTFKFTFEVKNNSTDVGVNYALTESGTNLISLGAGATGTFTTSAVEGSEDGMSVVTSSSAYFQIMNIRFAGEVDVESLSSALETAETVEQQATAYNNHSTFVVFYADNKKKIADLEFYGESGERTEEYCYDSNGDGIDDECYTNTYYYEETNARLIFADGSPSDLENYTSVGFAELEAELEEFANSLSADLE